MVTYHSEIQPGDKVLFRTRFDAIDRYRKGVVISVYYDKQKGFTYQIHEYLRNFKRPKLTNSYYWIKSNDRESVVKKTQQNLEIR